MADQKTMDFEQWLNQNEHEMPLIRLIGPEGQAMMYMLDRVAGALKDISDALDGIEADLGILADCVGDAEDDAEKFFVIAGGIDSYEH